MRDGDDGAVEAAGEQLDAGAAVVVEVGLGLVEQEHVRLLLEAGRERDQLSLAAREGAGREEELVGREPDLEESRAGATLGARPAGRLEPFERLLLAGEDAGHPTEVGDHLVAAELVRECRELALELDEIGSCRENGLERRPRVAGRVLVEVRDPGAAAARDLAAVGGLLAREDLQERRLAAAVRPDDTDSGLRLDRQVGAVEDEARTERLGDCPAGEQGHCVRSLRFSAFHRAGVPAPWKPATYLPLASTRMTAGWYVAPKRRASVRCGSEIDGHVHPYCFRKERARAFVSAAFRPRKWYAAPCCFTQRA